MDSNECCSYSAVDLDADYRKNAFSAKVLSDFSMTFTGGKIYVVMGRNGCGKSTLLRVLAGEKSYSGGHVSFECCHTKHSPSIEYMPQDYRQALFPWKTIRGNIHPWQSRETVASTSESRDTAINRSLDLMGLRALADSYPFEVSGGQQQLALLARCMVSDSRIVLLDEPFSAIDVIKRSMASEHLRKHWLDTGRIVICAMHEPDEAAILADEVLVFRGPPLTLGTCLTRGMLHEGQQVADFRDKILSEVHSVITDEGGVHEQQCR
jgi:ABC-type nitrate/sulfonate/bicarbonate transport system ATPase subunit